MKDVIYEHYTSGLKDFICDDIFAAIAIATKHCIPNMVENSLFINGKRAKVRMSLSPWDTITVRFESGERVFEGVWAFCETDGKTYCLPEAIIKKLCGEYREHKVIAFGDKGEAA